LLKLFKSGCGCYEQQDRYQKVNKESYFFIFRSSIYFFKKRIKLDVMWCKRLDRH